MQLHCEYTEFFSMDWENTQLIMIILVSGKDERVMGLRVEDTNTFNLYPYYFIFFKKWGYKYIMMSIVNLGWLCYKVFIIFSALFHMIKIIPILSE